MKTQQKNLESNSQAAGKGGLVNRAKIGLFIAAGVGVAGICAAVAGWQWSMATLALPDAKLPSLAQTKTGIQLFDKNDKFICTVYPDRDKDPVPLAKVSTNMRKAILAAEDHNFYEHHGVDPVGIARAAFVNYQHKKTEQGASTITQQLARNLYLNKNDRSILRKIREAVLAVQIENKYSKPKILETYLNEVYFGGGVHGIERASEHYFNKHASQLSISESAYLAGLVRCPTMLSADTGRALKRRDTIIAQMVRYGLITPAQAEQATSTTLAFKEGPHRFHYPQYVSYVMEELDKDLDSDLRRYGCKVYTNLDPKIQQMAINSLTQGIKNAPKGIDQGALVTISLKDGAILAMVGGVGDYSHNEWNRATHPHTAGSAFKPFVYLTGLMKGVLDPDSLIDDEPFAAEMAGAPPYKPKNFDGQYKGWMTCRDALAQSRNVCSVRVAQACGIENVIETAHAAGIKDQLDPYLSLALGACAVSPLDMANSYATLARFGNYMPTSSIRKIETADGHLVREFRPATSHNLPSDQVAQLVDVMQDVVRHGTGTAASLPGIAVAGKTGTADKGKDIWFIGFTPDTVTAVWGGNDLNHPVPGTHVTGGAVMAHIWKQFMSQYYSVNKPGVIAFAAPATPLTNENPHFSMTDLTALNAAKTSYTKIDSSSAIAQALTNGIASTTMLRQTIALMQPPQQAQPEGQAVAQQAVPQVPNGQSEQGASSQVISIQEVQTPGNVVYDGYGHQLQVAGESSSNSSSEIKTESVSAAPGANL